MNDSDIDAIDYAIARAETDGRVLVWEDDGMVWLQVDDGEPTMLVSAAEQVIAYLIGGSVGTPEYTNGDDE